MRDLGSSFSWLALYGAITGTVACARTGWQWWNDRANIKIEAHVSITTNDVIGAFHRDKLFVVLLVMVVNVGHRQASIKSISVPLTDDSMPIPHGMSPEMVESMKKCYIGGSLPVFGGMGETPVELKPDGGVFKREVQLRRGLPLLANKDNAELSTVTVELTSGKRYLAAFELLPDDKWPSNAI